MYATHRMGDYPGYGRLGYQRGQGLLFAIEVSEVASLALERFDVGDKILHAHAAQVLISLNLMKDRSPHRHLVGAVCGWSLPAFEGGCGRDPLETRLWSAW